MTLFRARADGTYPLSDFALRQRTPGVSLPVVIDAATADLVGVDIVQPVAQPVIPAGQMLVEGAPAQQPDGSWLQTWTLQPGPIDLGLADDTFGSDPWQAIGSGI